MDSSFSAARLLIVVILRLASLDSGSNNGIQSSIAPILFGGAAAGAGRAGCPRRAQTGRSARVVDWLVGFDYGQKDTRRSGASLRHS